MFCRQLYPTTILPAHKRKTVDLTNELAAHLFEHGEASFPYGTLLSKDENSLQYGIKRFFEFLIGKGAARRLQSRLSKERDRLRALANGAANGAANAVVNVPVDNQAQLGPVANQAPNGPF